MSGQQQIKELLSGFASSLSLLLKSFDDDDNDNRPAVSEGTLTNQSLPIAPSLLHTLAQITNLAEEAKHELSCPEPRQHNKSQLHSRLVRFASDVRSPLHGISKSVTVLSASSNKDGQRSHWDTGVGMVADRITNRASQSTSAGHAHHSSHRTTVLVSKRSGSKMQLRSRAVALTSKVRQYCDTSSLSSSSSASDSEDDPNFQISPEASDVEDISVVLNGGTSVPSAVSLRPDVVGKDSADKSPADSSPQPELLCPTPISRKTVKNRDASFRSADTSPVAPLLSRIRPCHVVLDKIDPLLDSIRHRPPPSWLKKEEQSVGARNVVASAGAEVVEPVKKVGQSRIRSGRKRTPDSVQFLPETPTSMEDQEIRTPPSCGSVRGIEFHKRPSPGQKHARVVNGSFIGHRPFRVTCRTNDRAESEPVEVAILKDDSWEERGEGVDESLTQQQQQRKSYRRRHAKDFRTVRGALSHSDSEVDILHVHEDPPARVRSSRRKTYRPRRVDPNLRMCLGQEEWLTPYKFESEEEEVMKDSESPSLLAHTDLHPPDVQEDPMDDTQLLPNLEKSSEEEEGEEEMAAAATTGEDENERTPTPPVEPAVPSVVKCTSCYGDVRWETEAIFTNPRLGVLICKTCWRNFQRGSFFVDDDGKETYCSLCGEGGSVVCCDSCEKTFCFVCVRRISGTGFLDSLIDSNNEEEWLCYCCNPTPISSHRAMATSLLQLLGAGKNQKLKAPPRKRRSAAEPKSKKFVSSTSGSEDVERKMPADHQNQATKTVSTPVKKESAPGRLSPQLHSSTAAAKSVHRNSMLAPNGISGAAHRSPKQSIVSSSSDDGMRFRRHKKKCVSPQAVPPQPICVMSDDSDFDLSATPVSMKKAIIPLSEKREEKRSTSSSVCNEDEAPMAVKKTTAQLPEKREKRNTSGSLCDEDEGGRTNEQLKDKKGTRNTRVQLPKTARADHTLVTLEGGNVKSSSSEPSDSGDEVKSEDVSLSDDAVFEPMDLRSRQVPHIPPKHPNKHTSGTSRTKNVTKRKQSISLRMNRLISESEYRPLTYNGKDESGSSSDVSVDKLSSDSGSSMAASSSRPSGKRERLESTSSAVSAKGMRRKKKRRCLADDLSSGSESDSEIIKNSSHKSLLSSLSSDSEPGVDAGKDKNTLGAAPLADEVGGVFPMEDQDVEYQVMGVVSSSADSTMTEHSAKKDRPKKKVRRKLIISSDSSDHHNRVPRKSILSKADSSSEDDFEDAPRRFRGNLGFLSRKTKRKSRRGVILASSDEESAGEDVNKADLESSDDSDEKDSQGKEKDVQGKRRNIRKLMPEKKLADETKLAQRVERERIERLKRRNKSFTERDSELTDRIILDKDPETDEVRLEVRPKLVPKILNHQRLGIKFLFNSCCEDLDRMDKEEGSGAILAHCMGLGKTLQVIAFLDAFFISNLEQFLNFKVLILCPVNTLLNWVAEFNRWIPIGARNYHVWPINDQQSDKRFNKLERWYHFGGVALMGYDMFRNMAMGKRVRTKRKREAYKEFLLDPGADFIACDEGHVLRHEDSHLSKIINQVRTKRRIVLSGTPLQNSLKEYYTMVNFVKPNLLGTPKEFHNRFINPITNGQCRDSQPEDVRLMKQRAHVLYELLQGCVDRRDYRILAESLPPKLEFVISVRMCPLQADLINRYLQKQTFGTSTPTSHDLFSTFANLTKVWNHPWVLKLDQQRKERQELRKRLFAEDSDNSFVVPDSASSEDGETTSTTSTSATKDFSRSSSITSDGMKEESLVSRSRSPTVSVEGEETEKTWFSDLLTDSCELDVNLSGKILFLRELLNETEKAREKVLLFSQSILLLNFIEEIIQKPETGFGEMIEGVHYYRLDGSTKQVDRADFMSQFNKQNNRIRLFLISTKAGSLGVNLIGANRVIIFDTCWNPSHDLQSIFRTYRFGQTKPVFVYRLLAQGTMEEKIYDRQVTKQSLSMRVVDQMQVGRHYNFAELQELFNFTPASPPAEDHPVPSSDNKPQDDFILSNILDRLQPKWVVNYHKHDSLLEHIFAEELSEEERKLAWENYNASKKMESHVYNVGLQAGSTSAAPGDGSLPQAVAPPNFVTQNRADFAPSQSSGGPLRHPVTVQRMPLSAQQLHWQRLQTQKRITTNIVQLFNIGFATCDEANALIAQKNSLVPFLRDPVRRQHYESISADLNRKLLIVNSTNSQISSILQSNAINEVLSDLNRRQLENLHNKYSAKLRELEQNQNASNLLPYSHSTVQ